MFLNSIPLPLRASVIDGIFYACMFGAGESYLSAFGVSLGLTPLYIGLLATLPLFIGSLSQLVGVRLMEKQISRRKIIVTGVTLQSFTWLLMASIPWIFSEDWQSIALISSVTLYSIAGQIVVPSWTSLMGDLVPDKERGMFFGTRNKISGYFLVSSFLICGYILKLAEVSHYTVPAFTCIFLFAGISRYISAQYLKKHPDPEYLFNPDQKFTFFSFIKKAPRSNFTKFVCFHALFNFALCVASPYFVIYMLRELQFSYWKFCLISGVGLLTNYMTMKAWGSFGDRYGNKRTLEIACSILSFIPFLWTLSSEVPYLIMLQFIGGTCVAGFQISSMNFLLDAVTPGKRGRCAAYMNTLTAGCVILGSLVGSALIYYYETHPLFTASTIQNLLITATIIRLTVVIIMLPIFKEVRRTADWSYLDRMKRIVRISPLAGEAFQFIAGMFRNRLR